MYNPEQNVTQQGQIATKLYFISSGDCDVYVNDEYKRKVFVQMLTPGNYFGEIALITNQRRTATVTTNGYSNIGYINSNDFKEIVTIFPDVKTYMRQNLI